MNRLALITTGQFADECVGELFGRLDAIALADVGGAFLTCCFRSIASDDRAKDAFS
jgi:hypothetical protein